MLAVTELCHRTDLAALSGAEEIANPKGIVNQ